MRRRTVLIALSGTAATLAGCVSDGDDSTGDNGEGNPNSDGEDDAGGDDNSGPDPETVVGQFDTAPSRPECEYDGEQIEVEVDGETREYETAATIPYPDPPESITEETVVDFLDAYEEAYVRHDAICPVDESNHILGVGYDLELATTYDWYDEIVFLFRAAGATGGLDDDGNLWVADIGYTGVVYAIDETGIARTGFSEAAGMEPEEVEGKAPDPLEDGELIASFE